jgi:hypothetical protein
MYMYRAFIHCLLAAYCTLANLTLLLLITQVIEDSSKIALGRYRKTPFKPDGWRFIMNRLQPNNSANSSSNNSSNSNSSSKEEEARLAALWEWRDAFAREVSALS